MAFLKRLGLLILFISIFIDSCIFYHSTKQFEAKHYFNKDSITIELYTIDSVIKNNIAFFYIIVRNNTNSYIAIGDLGSIWGAFSDDCMNPWKFNVLFENKNIYSLEEVFVEYIYRSDEDYHWFYRHCYPKDKFQFVFGVDFRHLEYWDKNPEQNQDYGTYQIYLKYNDCLKANKDYVGGWGQSNTITVKYLKEFNQTDYKLEDKK